MADTTVVSADESQQPTAAPIPGTVRLRNMRRDWRDITLIDGTNVRLQPYDRFNPVLTDPIPKKLLPPPVKKMVARNEIQILEEVV